ncbi:MAG TPA: tetratricopeptide repeat protein [Thermoanaerobaculia bacterium]|nr:tetratricopeptide repeat protein [Thermoanaerobaculia bacterium]
MLALQLVGCRPAVASSAPESWRTGAETGAAALEDGNAATARQRLLRAIELAEEEDAPPIERARLLVQLAKTHRAEGDYPRTVQTYREALAVAEEGPATDDLVLLQAEVLTELGNVYFPLRRPQDGLEALEEGLRLRRQVLDPAAPQVIESLELLGVAYGETNALEQAERLLREAADLVSGSPTASPEEKAGPLFSLSAILKRQGRRAEADEIRERALRLMNTNSD